MAVIRINKTLLSTHTKHGAAKSTVVWGLGGWTLISTVNQSEYL